MEDNTHTHTHSHAFVSCSSTKGKQSLASKQRVMRAYCDVTLRRLQVMQSNDADDRGSVGSLYSRGTVLLGMKFRAVLREPANLLSKLNGCYKVTFPSQATVNGAPVPRFFLGVQLQNSRRKRRDTTSTIQHVLHTAPTVEAR